VLLQLVLNQSRAGIWPARDWFLEIAFVSDVCVRVPAPRLLITSDVMKTESAS